MSWSLNLGTIAGTTIRVHFTFLLLLVWIWLMHYQIGGTAAAWQGVVFILAVFACVVLHEFGHIAAARHFGIATPDITLLPIGGVARLERMPEEPGQEFVIAIAGPLVNVAIAALIFIVLGGPAAFEQMAVIEDPRTNFLVRLAGVNVFLVLFNMIPAFPMDGGRILRAALASRLSWSRATQIAATIGQGLAFVFGFIGLLYNPLLIFIGIFVYLAAAAEAQNAQIRQVATSVLVGDVMITEFARLERSATLDEAVEMLLATTQHEFPVVDGAGKLRGMLTRAHLVAGLQQRGGSAPAVELMAADIPLVGDGEKLSAALEQLQKGASPAVGVVDSGGALVGYVTIENIGELMMLRGAVAR